MLASVEHVVDHWTIYHEAAAAVVAYMGKAIPEQAIHVHTLCVFLRFSSHRVVLFEMSHYPVLKHTVGNRKHTRFLPQTEEWFKCFNARIYGLVWA